MVRSLAARVLFVRSAFTFSYSVFFLGMCFVGISAFAEEADVAPIVVTGAARNESLDEMQASVSVVTEAEILESDPSFFQNQILQLPNVNFSGGTARPRFFQIRGIGELEQYEGAPNSSVAVIVDDVDLTGIGAALTLFDVEQLEVHRGPQPIRFGSSALAGAINVVTGAPTEQFDGMALLSAGNDSLFSAGIASGGALTDTLSMRVTAFGHRQDGFRDNEFSGATDTNEREEFTGRAKFLLQPSDDTQFTLTLTNVDLNNGYDAFTIFNGFDTQSDRPGRDEERLRLVSLQGRVELSPETTLQTTTSLYRSEVDYSFDGDWGNNPFWAPFDPYDFFSDSDRERTVFAQQFRVTGAAPELLGSAEYLLGGFFQSLEEKTVTREFADDQIFDFLDSDYQADTYATFAHLKIPFADRWSLSTGVRGEYRDTRYRDSRESFFVPDDLMWGGNVMVQRDHSEDFFSYLLLSRGFRGGGFNASPSLMEDRREYSPESLINVEFGNRFSLLDGELKGAVNLFFNKRDDQQVKLGLQVDPADPLSFTFLTDNAARGEGAGLEAELDYQLSESLVFRVNGALLHTEITSADPLLGGIEGRDQSHAPNWQYAVMGEYFLSDAFSAMAGVSGRDSFYFDDSHDEKSGVYNLFHASLRYSAPSWDLLFWGRNLTDKEYAVRGFFFGNEPPDFPATQYVQLGDPRSFGVTWTYHFGGI
ncbi:TonB-dependent receptor [bacterium]|nr:TonB-dependent receptor [bacterium]